MRALTVKIVMAGLLLAAAASGQSGHEESTAENPQVTRHRKTKSSGAGRDIGGGAANIGKAPGRLPEAWGRHSEKSSDALTGFRCW
jgi:hypothetical protein